jgi:hypothetical protein
METNSSWFSVPIIGRLGKKLATRYTLQFGYGNRPLEEDASSGDRQDSQAHRLEPPKTLSTAKAAPFARGGGG